MLRFVVAQRSGDRVDFLIKLPSVHPGAQWPSQSPLAKNHGMGRRLTSPKGYGSGYAHGYDRCPRLRFSWLRFTLFFEGRFFVGRCCGRAFLCPVATARHFPPTNLTLRLTRVLLSLRHL